MVGYARACHRIYSANVLLFFLHRIISIMSMLHTHVSPTQLLYEDINYENAARTIYAFLRSSLNFVVITQLFFLFLFLSLYLSIYLSIFRSCSLSFLTFRTLKQIVIVCWALMLWILLVLANFIQSTCWLIIEKYQPRKIFCSQFVQIYH